mgnify:CR=1
MNVRKGHGNRLTTFAANNGIVVSKKAVKLLLGCEDETDRSPLTVSERDRAPEKRWFAAERYGWMGHAELS